MRHVTCAVFGLWACAALASGLLHAQPNLDRRTTIDVSNAAPADVYGSLARTLGCELSLPPEVKQPVTMRLANITIRTALNALSESLGCRWALDGKTLRVESASAKSQTGTGGVVGGVPGGVAGGVPGGIVGGVPGGVKGGVGGVDFKERLERKTPAEFHFTNVPLRSVLEALGRVADLDVRTEEPEASQIVSVDIGGRTVLAALKAIEDQLGFQKAVVFSFTPPGSDKKMFLKVGPRKKQ